MSTAGLASVIALTSAPMALAETPGEAFCAENQRHLEYSNGEMPFEVDEAVAWITQRFNISETEAVRVIDHVGETHWSGLNGRWEVRCHDQ